LEIILAKNAGFCFGANNALETVFQLIEKKEKPIYTLGQIIHNEQMINSLEKQGVVTLYDIDDIRNIQDGAADLVIRAHGIPPWIYDKLKTYSNFSIIDRTCPYVQKIHRLVNKKYKEGYKIIIVGDKKHPEVIGINGECEDSAIIINSIEDVYNLGEIKGKICVVSQTTFNQNKWETLASALKEKYNEIEFFNTICNSTSIRQKEAEEIAKKVDMMIVIGGKNSSNTNKLYEICKTYCKETYKIETPGELPPVNINKIKKIGITAGASTPDWIIKEVLQKMEELNKQVQAQIESQEPEEEMSFEEALENSIVTIRSGQIVKGTIFKINDDGVIVDLGGKYEGTIPIDELSDDPYFKPDENLKVGQEIEVLVLRVIDSEAVVILSKKRVDIMRGWDILERAFEDKTPVRAKVMEVVNGGVMAIAYGIKVFVPASQVSDRFVKDLKEYLRQIITVRIIDFNRGKKKVIGSQRIIIEEQKEQLSKEVWESIEIGKIFKGKVKSFTNFGAFVDIGGVDGLVHISEISILYVSLQYVLIVNLIYQYLYALKLEYIFPGYPVLPFHLYT
jgi:small subunit ribosomal protein S1